MKESITNSKEWKINYSIEGFTGAILIHVRCDDIALDLDDIQNFGYKKSNHGKCLSCDKKAPKNLLNMVDMYTWMKKL